MRFGIAFPHKEIPPEPAAIRDYVQAVEGLGYDYLTVIDHVIQAGTAIGPDHARFYTRERPYHEVMVLIAYLAGFTRTLQIASAVIILPQRETALLAKQAAEVDVLLEGRFICGVGLGWSSVEYEAMGRDFTTRGRRIEEQTVLLRRLWTEELVTFEGRWHRVRDAGLNPMPVQRPIPLWFGAFNEKAIRRAARLADGWFLNPRMGPGNESRHQIETFRESAQAAGRDPDALPIDATVHAKDGPEDAWREKIRQWHGLGASRITLRMMDCGLPSIEAHMDVLRRFRKVADEFA